MKTIIRLYGVYLNFLAIIAPSRAAKIGFLLFCKPFRTTITQKQKEFFNSSDKFLIQHNGESIQGYRWGKGDRKILFLHGWQSHTYRWKAYIEALDHAKFTIYSLDAPGHGLSSGNFLTVPVYSELIEKFIREKGQIDSVIGHSLGGFSLLHTVHKHPLLQINQVILLAPPGEANEFISVFKNTLKLNSRTVELVTDYFAAKYNVGPEYFSTTRFAEGLKLRGLIIHDVDDAEAPHQHSVRLNGSWERSQLVSTKGFGHNLRSASVVKAVSDFITEPNATLFNEKHVSSMQERQ